jgi:spermidine/putrescine-binding protein
MVNTSQPSNLSPSEIQDVINELDRERNMNSMLKNINETLEKYIKELEDKLMELNENSQLSVQNNNKPNNNLSGESKE